MNEILKLTSYDFVGNAIYDRGYIDENSIQYYQEALKHSSKMKTI